jgi:hypothetical protein
MEALNSKYAVGDVVYIRNPQLVIAGPNPELEKKLGMSPRSYMTPTVPLGSLQTERRYRVKGNTGRTYSLAFSVTMM